ncbi:MAG: CsgG/HfaB family protein, partial [Acidobacteriota bacterium]|nr:CsgG/HfaB family protein [Acidobacteriota bacterium]
MSTNLFGKFTLSAAVIFLLAVLTIYAQPPKKRGVVNKPKSTPTPTQSQQPLQLPASTPQTPKKKTIVVLDFSDVSLTADSVKRPIGKQLAVLLTTELAKRGNYSVISQRDKETAEQRVKSLKEGKDRSYAAQIGKELSANLVVFGDLIEYTIVTETSNKYIRKDIKHNAKVGFTIAIVDVSTNEVKDGVIIEHVATSKDTDYGVYGNSKPLTEDQRITMLTEASKVGVVKGVDKLVQLITVTALPGVASGATPKPSDVTVPKPAEVNNLTPTIGASTESEVKPIGGKKEKSNFLKNIFGGKDKDKQNKESSKDDKP